MAPPSSYNWADTPKFIMANTQTSKDVVDSDFMIGTLYNTQK
jgi:hypothetical protein